MTEGAAPIQNSAPPASDLGLADLFRPGPGPSSSHTVGPMRSGRHFAKQLLEIGFQPTSLRVQLFGSLAATGIGHGTNRAVVLGLAGAKPDHVSSKEIEEVLPALADRPVLTLLGGSEVPFSPSTDIVFEPRTRLPYHANALRITAWGSKDGLQGRQELALTYYSMGGGFISVQAAGGPPVSLDQPEGAKAPVPFVFHSGDELLQVCLSAGLSIADVVRENELALRTEDELQELVRAITEAMFESIREGCQGHGVLPGGLGVPRRAGKLREKLEAAAPDPLALLDWVSLYALAINEQNAAGHKVVTAPTNGSAGVVPAVLAHYIVSVAASKVGGLENLDSPLLADLEALRDSFPEVETSVQDFMFAALAVGAIIKTNASIAGAEVGCQGEIGSASAMAAAGLAQAMGGNPAQVENAAEIAMEHSLGLTCDPVAGLVQIPCIERNAIGAVKAISAARMALSGDGHHRVSLDTAVKTMAEVGQDMLAKYKETAVGGLAVNVVEC